MSHSLIGANRRAHLKIVAVALAGAMGLMVLGSSAWRADTVSTAQERADGPIIKAGKPTVSATAAVRIIR